METNILISKFWNRIGALVIDTIILGIIGIILGLTIQDYLIRIGSYGILIGLSIAVLYFTIYNSKLFNGQTPGKKVMGIQVVDKEGNTLSLQRSFLRALILYAPYFLIKVEVPGAQVGSDIFYLKIISCMSLMLGVIVIYIFNKGNRQSLHDLIIGSFVVTTVRTEDKTEFPTVTKAAYYIFGFLTFLLIVFTIVGVTPANSSFGDLIAIQKSILNIDGVLNAGVSKNTSTVYGESKSTTQSLVVQLWVKELPQNIDDLENTKETRTVIKTILETEPNINQYDIISITLIKGFNIGIASWKNSRSCGKTPVEWKSLLDK
ncbi:MAG: RDD family protein [Bacteroidota bacterium]